MATISAQGSDYIHGCPACRRHHLINCDVNAILSDDPDDVSFRGVIKHSWHMGDYASGLSDSQDLIGIASVNSEVELDDYALQHCDYIIEHGKIIYNDDCTHDMAGTEQDLPDLDSFVNLGQG